MLTVEEIRRRLEARKLRHVIDNSGVSFPAIKRFQKNEGSNLTTVAKLNKYFKDFK